MAEDGDGAGDDDDGAGDDGVSHAVCHTLVKCVPYVFRTRLAQLELH